MATDSASLPDINYALVEGVRPPMYRAMKYWGKKPHNIWSQFIERYCPPDGTILDPFVGSGIAAFEAVKLGRKVIAFDLNPLSSFTIEVLASSFDEDAFLSSFDRIAAVIENDSIYQEHYMRDVAGVRATVFNYRWNHDEVVRVFAKIGAGKKARSILRIADSQDKSKAEEMRQIDIPYWYPPNEFPATPSIGHKFVRDVGGNGFQFLWTRRNLYILARIFHEIREEENEDVQRQLIYGFLQTLHLTSKMVVPRNTASNRDFSGSWGRADYMIRRRSMEQNPLVVFRRSCIEKQGVVSAMRDAKASLPERLKLCDVKVRGKIQDTADINYGIVDVADLSQYIKPKSIDFIITDPPYAGLVFYLDLSLVWLVWLQKLDNKYIPDLMSEITIKKGETGREEYRRRLRHDFEQLHNCLKDDAKIVFTFHHQKVLEWNDFINATRFAGFKLDKMTHQYNKRSGESNVSNPYGTSAADFYVRCVKYRDVDFTNDASGLKHFAVEKVKEIIAQRNEATPFIVLRDSLFQELCQAGYVSIEASQAELSRILAEQEGKVLERTPNLETKAGDFWWFVDPSQYINYPNVPLTDRVDEAVLSLLRRKVSVKFDDVLAELFRAYPDGLTPHPRTIKSILEKYAYTSAGKWKIKDTTKRSSTEHTAVIKQIVNIGRRVGVLVYVGKREQSEYCDALGSTLGDLADMRELRSFLSRYNSQQIERIEMIDALWLNKDEGTVASVFEVENSTGFLSAITRGSNLEKEIPKFMIIPNKREEELLRSDPLFKTSFAENHWRYARYDSIAKLAGYSNPSINEVLRISKTLS